MDYELLLQCYKTGQVSEAQWTLHLKDNGLVEWLKHNG